MKKLFTLVLTLTLVLTIASAVAEHVSAIIGGVDFTTNEVYVISKGEIRSYFEDEIDIDDVLYGKDVVFDENGTHLRMGCRVLIDYVDGRIEGVKFTGMVKKTPYVYEFENDDEELVAYATDRTIAAYIMVSRNLAVTPIPMVY